MLGAVMYIANVTRPDLLTAVNVLAKFSRDPGPVGVMGEMHYRTRTFRNIAPAGSWEKEKGAAKCAAPNSPVFLFWILALLFS